MNNYFGTPLPPEELQRQLVAQRRGQQQQQQQQPPPPGTLSMLNTTTSPGSQHGGPLSAMPDLSMGATGDSLDEIIRQNTHELQRRRSVPHSFHGQMTQEEAERRMSVMDFANSSNDDFGFSPNAFAGAYGNMGGQTGMAGPSGGFAQPNMVGIGDANGFSNMPGNLMDPASMMFSNLNMGQMQSDPNSMDMFDSSGLPSRFANNDYMDLGVDNGPLSAASSGPPTGMGLKAPDDDMIVDQTYGGSGSGTPQGQQNMNVDQNMGAYQANMTPSLAREVSNATTYQSPASGTSQSASHSGMGQSSVTAPTPTTGTPATSAPTPGGQAPRESKDKSVYSKSGFDMLRALWYVATRKNQTIKLGAVDMSCAFVVCDVTLNDCPIIYVSDNFQNLTGYNRHEIVGQNCRFLQAPDGKVEAGSKREFVENDAVYTLKRKIAEGQEVQQSLINYRKGGKPFLNLLTMVPIPWDNMEEIRYFIGFQIDLVECPDAISKNDNGGQIQVNYMHSDIGQYIFTPPPTTQWEPENGQTLGIDDVSTLLQQFNPTGVVSDWHKQSWDKMLLENTDDVIHVLSLKGLFLYLSPACKKVLEYDTTDLVGNSLSSICHPSDIVPVTRELKDTVSGSPVNIVFRIRRKQSGYTWFESHGSLFVESGKGRKCIILVGRKRPVFALHRKLLEDHGGIGDSEFWTKLSTSGMFLFVSSNVRSLLDLHPENLQGASLQELMRKESRAEFGRAIEKARKGKIVTCKHEVQNKRGQVLQAQTTMYPGDADEGQKPTFLLAQTRLVKASSRSGAPNTPTSKSAGGTPAGALSTMSLPSEDPSSSGQLSGTTLRANIEAGGQSTGGGVVSQPGGGHMALGNQDAALAADDNIFDELKTTRCTSWQYELRQMEKVNRLLAEELAQLLSNKKRRKRRKGSGNIARDCANCHTRNTPEWRRGPSGNRDLCNSCGLRWAKQTGRVSPRNSIRGGNGDTASKKSNSPIHSSPLHREVTNDATPPQPDGAASNRSSTTTNSNTAVAGIGDGSNTSASASNNGSIGGSGGGGHGNGSGSSVSGGDSGGGGGGGSASAKAHAHAHPPHLNPPQSQPLLEGGSGFGGGGMEMTAISEDVREGG